MRFSHPLAVIVSGLFAPVLLFSGCSKQSSGAQAKSQQEMQLAAGEAAAEAAEAAGKAVSSLATARCEGVSRCEAQHLAKAPRKVWPLSDHEYCMNVMRTEAQELIDACGDSGIDEAKVESCAKKWSTLDDCKKVERPLGSLKECSLTELCKK